MTLQDRVARFLHQGLLEQAKAMGVTPAYLLSHFKRTINGLDPRISLTLSYTVRLGDVLKPKKEMTLFIANSPIHITTSQRYVVYSLSYPNRNCDLSEVYTNHKDSLQFTLLVYMCDDDSNTIDLTRIYSVVTSTSVNTLVSILDGCELVTNVYEQLD